MRGRHALKPAGTARRRRRTGAMASRCRRSFADRGTRPCDLLRRNLPAWVCNVPDSPTTHPRTRLHRANARANCRALPGDRASPTWGKIGRNLRFDELREDGYLQPRPVASAGFYIRLLERRPGTAPVAPPPTQSLHLAALVIRLAASDQAPARVAPPSLPRTGTGRAARGPEAAGFHVSSGFVGVCPPGASRGGNCAPNHLIMSFFQQLSTRSSGDERADSRRPQPGMAETCRTELARQKDARSDRHDR